jgi:hypothetical protein
LLVEIRIKGGNGRKKQTGKQKGEKQTNKNRK